MKYALVLLCLYVKSFKDRRSRQGQKKFTSIVRGNPCIPIGKAMQKYGDFSYPPNLFQTFFKKIAFLPVLGTKTVQKQGKKGQEQV